jgi:hypothetical protein
VKDDGFIPDDDGFIPDDDGFVPDEPSLARRIGGKVADRILPGASMIPDIVGRAALAVDQPDVYESLTGRKFLSEEELNSIEGTREQRTARRQQSMPAANLVEDIKALPTDILRAATSYGTKAVDSAKKTIKGYQEGGLSGGLSANMENLEDFAGGAKDLAKENVRSLVEFGDDPAKQMANAPLEALANAASVVGVGGAVGRAVDNTSRAARVARTAEKMGTVAPGPGVGATAARGARGVASEVAQAVSPIPLPGSSLRDARYALRPSVQAKLATSIALDAAERTGKGRGLVEALGDPTVRVDDDVVRMVAEYQDTLPTKRTQAARSLVEPMKDLNAAQRGELRNLLAAEDARKKLPSLPARMESLQQYPYDLIKGAQDYFNEGNRGRALGKGVSRIKLDVMGDLKEAVNSANAVENALVERPLIFVDQRTGQDLGGLEYVLSGKPIPPEHIGVRVAADDAVFGEKAQGAVSLAKEALAVRRGLAKLSAEANGINVGLIQIDNPGKGKAKIQVPGKLLGDSAFVRHVATYTPDVYKKGEAPGVTRSDASKVIAKTDVGQFNRADFKQRNTFETRVAEGAVEDFQQALAQAAYNTVADIERYRLLESVSKMTSPAPGGRWPRVMDETTWRQLERVEGFDPKQYVFVPESYAANSHILQYGKLAGNYIDRGIWNYLTTADDLLMDVSRFGASGGYLSKVAAVLSRTRSGWMLAKVVLNSASHMNNLMGSLLHQVVDGGVLGPAGLGKQLSKSIARGFGSAKAKDGYWRAATDVGLIQGDTMREVAGVVGANFGRGNFFRDFANSFRTLPSNIKKIAKDPGPINTPLSIYELGVRDNPIALAVARIYSATEDSSRLAIFERAIDKLAREGGFTVEQALQNKDIVKAAKEHVELYHYSYRDVPKLLAAADKFGGLLPFARYGYKALFGLGDAVVANPAFFRTSRAEADRYRDNANEQDREFLDVQPGWSRDRLMPITDETALDLRYWSPYGQVEDLFGIREKGSYGAEPFSETTDLEGLSGPFSAAANILAGKDPMTDKPLRTTGEKVDAALIAALPGTYYHATNKLIPALQATEEEPALDRRGRQLDPLQGLAQTFGVRLEQRQDGQVQSMLARGMRDRLKELRNKYRTLYITSPSTEHDRISAEYQAEIDTVLELYTRKSHSKAAP